MKTQLKKTLLLLIIPCIISSCTKSDDPQDQLPPITQIGANTFGLIYDGIIFTPKRYNGSTTITENQIPIVVEGHYTGTKHYSNRIRATRGEDIKNLSYTYIYIYQLPSKGKGEYILDDAIFEESANQPYHSYIFCGAKSPSTGEWKNYGSFTNSGKITITKKDGFIFSGTFSGKLKEENGSEIIKITAGRFDINKKTLN